MAITVGTLTTLLTTELNTLTTGSYSAVGPAYDNRTNLNMWADFELVVTYGTNPTANSTCDLYLVPAVDNTNYADGGGSVAPSINYYVGSFSLRAVTTAQRIAIRGAVIPPDQFKAVLLNNAGQSTAASSNTVKMSPYKV
jgi:hypothetical protein